MIDRAILIIKLIGFQIVCVWIISCKTNVKFQEFSVFQDCYDCPEMVVIPPGEFIMGSTYEDRKAELILDQSKGWDLRKVRGSEVPENNMDEEPPQKVTITYPFAIGKYVVTKKQFEIYLKETGTEINGCTIPVEGSLEVVDSVNWRNPYFPTTDSHPIVCIS